MRLENPTSPQARETRLAKWVRRLLRLYPRAWRERYGEEVTLIVAQRRITFWTLLDVALGAVDAHIHSDLLPGRLLSMSQRTRSSEIAIFCAFVIFCVAWLALRLVRDPLSIWLPAVTAHPELLTALTILDIAGIVAALAVVIGGAPILLTAILQALRTHRWKLLALFTVPILAIVTLVIYWIVAIPGSTARQSSDPSAPFTSLAVALQLGLALLILLAIGGSALAIASVIGRSELSERILRYALWPAGIVTAAIAVGLLAAMALTVLIFDEAPQVSSSPPLHAGDLLMMLLAFLLAAFALNRGIQGSAHREQQ